MATLNRTIVGGKENARQMLEAAGIGEYNVTLSLPYIYFMPKSCDPYTQGVMQLVEGLQNMLKARGQAVPKDGVLGESTKSALRQFAGPGWADKTWLQLYGDVLRGKRAPGYDPRLQAAPGLDSGMQTPTAGLTDVVGGLATNPLAWIAGGAAALFFYRKRARR